MVGCCMVKDLVLLFGKVLSVMEVSYELCFVCGLDLIFIMVVNSVFMIMMYLLIVCL